MKNGRQYRIDLTRWATQAQVSLDALARQTCQQIAENVQRDTPFDTGNLLSSWQPSIGTPVRGPATGGATTTVGAVVAGMKAGDIFYMTNGAAYARRLEYGFVGEDSMGRYYNQRGRFFVRKNMRRAKLVVQEIVRELRSKPT